MIRRPPRSTLFSLHDALPIYGLPSVVLGLVEQAEWSGRGDGASSSGRPTQRNLAERSEEHTSELQSLAYLVCRLLLEKKKRNTTQCCQPKPHAATSLSRLTHN